LDQNPVSSLRTKLNQIKPNSDNKIGELNFVSDRCVPVPLAIASSPLQHLYYSNLNIFSVEMRPDSPISEKITSMSWRDTL
jgi:hypothetical protein